MQYVLSISAVPSQTTNYDWILQNKDKWRLIVFLKFDENYNVSLLPKEEYSVQYTQHWQSKTSGIKIIW